VIPWSLVPDDGRQNWQQYYFYAPFQGVHQKDYDPSSVLYSDFSQYESAPFYFVNGGLVGDYTTHDFDGEIRRYPNESYRILEYSFYPPGRDLFSANSGGGVGEAHHIMKYAITTWRPMIGSSIRIRQSEKYYSGRFYMTINGASSWCGNDITSDGFFTDSY
jgi:hypothetical protein